VTEQHDLVARLYAWAAEKSAIGAVPPTINNHARKLKIGEGLYRALPELVTRIEALESRQRVLREALEPFATWADHYRASTHDHYVPECEIDGPGHSLTITLGDFRRARAALAGDAP
jgi:hypothetical protein